MLTADLAMSWRRGRRIGPRSLDPRDASALSTADDVIRLVSEYVGRPRGDLERAFEEYVGVGTDYRTLRGLFKLLDERCVYATSSVIEPAALRRDVFRRAAQVHPVDAESRKRVWEESAKAHDVAIEDAENSLHADLGSQQILVEFETPQPSELLDHYNLAQAQALLYRALRMTLHIRVRDANECRRIFDAIKRHRLIHTLRGDEDAGFTVTLDGPASVLHRTQKYGIHLAAFLPTLLGCAGWRLTAEIETKAKGIATYEIDSESTTLRAPPGGEEPWRHPAVAKLLEALDATVGDWRISPATTVVDLVGAVVVPDAVACGPDGARVFLEVLGFWTPRSLEQRLHELTDSRTPYLLLVSRELLASREDVPEPRPNVLIFKTSLDVRVLRERLDSLRCVTS